MTLKDMIEKYGEEVVADCLVYNEKIPANNKYKEMPDNVFYMVKSEAKYINAWLLAEDEEECILIIGVAEEDVRDILELYDEYDGDFKKTRRYLTNGDWEWLDDDYYWYDEE